MPRPSTNWRLVILDVDVYETRVGDVVLHGIDGVQWTVGLVADLVEHVSPQGKLAVSWESSVVALDVAAWLDLFNPSAWLEVAVGLLVKTLPAVGAEGAEAVAQVDEVPLIAPCPWLQTD